jgi:hypothetical protein
MTKTSSGNADTQTCNILSQLGTDSAKLIADLLVFFLSRFLLMVGATMLIA